MNNKQYIKSKIKAHKKQKAKKAHKATMQRLNNKHCRYCRLRIGAFNFKRYGYCSDICKDKHIEKMALAMVS